MECLIWSVSYGVRHMGVSGAIDYGECDYGECDYGELTTAGILRRM